eukprot:6803685-Prymnesium_polylepis.2
MLEQSWTQFTDVHPLSSFLDSYHPYLWDVGRHDRETLPCRNSDRTEEITEDCDHLVRSFQKQTCTCVGDGVPIRPPIRIPTRHTDGFPRSSNRSWPP